MAVAHARAKKLFIRAIKSPVIEWFTSDGGAANHPFADVKGLIFHLQVLAVGTEQQE